MCAYIIFNAIPQDRTVAGKARDLFYGEGNMKKFMAVLLVVVLFLTQGCAHTDQLRLDEPPFGETAFSAEIRGARGENGFSAKIGIVPVEGGTCIRVEYTAPEALAGIVVETQCGEDGTLQGEAEVLRSGVSTRLDAECLQGLLAPVACLLRLADHTAVKRDGETYELQFENGAVLRVDGRGDLISYDDASLRYDVVWLEHRISS